MSPQPRSSPVEERAGPVEITRADLYERIWAAPMTVVAAQLGLSANGLAKICDRLLIPCPQRGHWSRVRAGNAEAPRPLPPPPPGSSEIIQVSQTPSRSRRARTRTSPDLRREQMMAAAAEIVAAEGLTALTMKAIARRIGISEAQAHNYFSRRADLLVALARRELHAMEAYRRDALAQGRNRQDRVAFSTLAYLEQAAERGVLMQILTQSPEVRLALRAEHGVAREWNRRQTSHELERRYGVPADLARATTSALTSVSLRAGRLLAGGKLSLPVVQKLTLAIVSAGNRSVVGDYRPRKPAP